MSVYLQGLSLVIFARRNVGYRKAGWAVAGDGIIMRGGCGQKLMVGFVLCKSIR